MKKTAFIFLAALGFAVTLRAENYVPQATLNVAAGFITGMDSDILGNLYVIGAPPGAAPFSLPPYSVWEYHTPDMSPLFAFNTGVNNPMAFQVEGSGTVDLLYYGTSGLMMERFTNTGVVLSQTAIPYMPTRGFTLIAAIDKFNQRVYVSQFFNTFCLDPLIGCNSVPPGTQGLINQYDFQGHLLQTLSMPGNSSSYGSCYSPWKMAVDPEGDLWVDDATCSHLLKFSPTGGSPADYPLSGLFASALWTDPASNVYVSQSLCSAGTCQGAIAKYSSDGVFQTGITGVSPVGFAWDGRIVYVSSSTPGTLVRLIYDAPPSVPAETGPINVVSQHLNSANLTWQNANDPDGDPISYRVYLGPSPNNLVFIGSTTETSFSSPGLNFGQTYYWQAVAQDSYLGIPVLSQPAPVVGFSLKFSNQPPGAFSATSGMGTSVSRNNSVTLSWQPSVDPDGDPVDYDVYGRTAGQPLGLVGSTSGNSWTVSNLAFGATYFWSVNARDPYGATTAIAGGEQSYYLVFQNSPPGLPPILAGSGSQGQHTLTPQATLGWSPVSDPDGDPVNYRLYFGTSSANLAATQDGAPTTFTIGSAQLATTYYWQVAAYDPYGGASTTPVQMLYIFLQNQPPGSFSALSASGTITTRLTDETLSWATAIDPDGDPVVYDVYWRPAAQSSATLAGSTSGNSWPVSGLAFGSTYYWFVAARDSFGATTPIRGGEQALFWTFENRPPLPFAVQSGTGTILTRGAWQMLSWADAVDPDGDPVSYSVSIGTSPNALAAVQTSTATSFALNFQIGATYYWQVVATDPYGGSQATPVQKFLPQFLNSPPSAPVNLSKTGTIVYHGRTASQSFFWQPSIDPEGDAINYNLYIGTDTSALAVSTNVPLGFSVDNLAMNTAYYYKIVAVDAYGAASASPLNWVYYQFGDSGPGSFQMISTTGTVSTRLTTAVLSWTSSADPDGDAVAYRVFTGTSPVGLTLASDQPGTAVTLSNISFGTTYFWRVDAYDSYGTTTAINGGIQSFLYSFQNSAPSTPTYLSTAQAFAVHDASAVVALAWAPAIDPDGDPVSYRIDLASGASSWSFDRGPGLSYSLNTVLGATYYWRIEASDQYGATSVGAWQSFYTYIGIHPPVIADASQSSLPSGTVRSVVNFLRLVWPVYVSPDNDAIIYDLYLTNSSESLIYSGSTNSYVLNGLSFSVPYAYRIVARDNFGGVAAGPAGSFTLATDSAGPDPYNYPNPFRIAGGTRFVFTSPGGVDHLRISIYSAYQDLVWRKDVGALAPGVHEVSWDGNDLSGQKVFSGLYVAVFESLLGRQMTRLVGVR